MKQREKTLQISKYLDIDTYTDHEKEVAVGVKDRPERPYIHLST